MKSKLIYKDAPFGIYQPVLATKIGLDAAVILQQVHFLSYQGKVTVERSFCDWRKCCPWLSKRSFHRIFSQLQRAGYLAITHERGTHNRTYTLNYEKLPGWNGVPEIEKPPIPEPQLGANLAPNPEKLGANLAELGANLAPKCPPPHYNKEKRKKKETEALSTATAETTEKAQYREDFFDVTAKVEATVVKRAKPVEKPPDTRLHPILKRFRQKYKEYTGEPYCGSYTKDLGILQNGLNKELSLDSALRAVETFFARSDDWHFKNRGAQVSVFVSQLAVLLQLNARQAAVAPRRRLLSEIQGD